MLALLLAAAVLNLGAPAPPLTVERLLQAPEGTAANWQALKGKAVVLAFWDTRCASCVEQIPHWNALAEKFKSRPIQFIAIGYEDPEAIAAFLQQRPMSGWIALDPAGATFEAYGVESVPRAVLVDAKGAVRGTTSLQQLTEADLEALLGGRELRLAKAAAPGCKPAIRPGRAPSLISPLPDARVPYTVTFRWSRVPGTAAYTIQVAGGASFRAPLVVDDKAGEPVYHAELSVAGPLWWRVRAMDSQGKLGPWSAPRKLDVLQPPLADSGLAFTLTPASVAGGEFSEGLVTLDQPAPPDGATVLLSSSDASKVTMPAGVLFASGKTAVSFSIGTVPVSGDTPVRITAASKSETQAATLNIGTRRPRAPLASVAVTPAILTAGERAQGIVTLANLAPSATTVRLATSDASRVSVPATVRIPAGSTTANFPVQTVHGTTSGSVIVTASLEDAVKTAIVNLNGAASSELLPAPQPLHPEDAAILAYDEPVEFSWSDVMGAASYTIEVDQTGSFAGPLAASRTVPAPSLAISPLPYGTLWWRVRANDANGAPGRWSPPRAFLVR
jgi:peroxiredoxin